MKRSIIFLAPFLAVILAATLRMHAQSPAPAKPSTAAQPAAKDSSASADALPPATVAAMHKSVESFLRKSFAWGPAFEMKFGPITMSPMEGLYQVTVTVGDKAQQGASDSAIVYLSKNGRYMFRGELRDLTTDPQAETRQQIQLTGYASKGPANAKVEVVEFGDFECPSCKQLEYVLRVVLPKYPQIRYVFKDYPLDQIHPWASTAALAGHCVLKQSQDMFWKFHDTVYDDQDLISTENAASKLADLATAAGADLATYQSCMADPKTAEIVKKSVDEGRKLDVTGTPTTFVNGRRIVGPDQALLEQYIQFDMNPIP